MTSFDNAFDRVIGHEGGYARGRRVPFGANHKDSGQPL